MLYKKMNRLSFITITNLICLFIIFPGVSVAGTDAISSLALGADARAVGMGGAFCALADGVGSIHWNPAGIALLKRPGISVSDRIITLGTNYINSVFASPIGNSSGVGAGILYYSVGDVETYDENAYPTGDLTEKQGALFLSFGYQIPSFGSASSGGRLFIGGNLKYAHHNLSFDETTASANGFGVDVSLLYEIAKSFRLGATMKSRLNMKWDTDDGRVDEAPLNMRLGLLYRVELEEDSEINLAVDIDQNRAQPLKLHAGVEMTFSDEPHSLSLRAGLSHLYLETRGAEIEAKKFIYSNLEPSFGIGFRWKPGGDENLEDTGGTFLLNYALSIESLGAKNFLSLGYEF